MSTPYALRVVVQSDDEMAAVKRWISDKSPGHLVIQHDADEDERRPHWHALLWSDKKDQALRVDFKKANPAFVGNKAYSLTPIVKKGDDDPVEAYERYMCHGNCDGDPVKVISAFGAKYTAEWFAAQNKAFYTKRKEFKRNEQKRSETKNMVNDLLKECQEAAVSDKLGIARKLVSMYVRESRPLNSYYAKGVVKTVWAKLNGAEAVDDLACELANF